MIFIALAVAAGANAQKKTFIREYLYQASERDSKITARAAAIREMQTLLLLEIGQALQSEQTLRKQSVLKDGKETFSESFSQEVMAITAGFVEMKILDESWNGKTYYIEAKMTVDTKEVSQRVAKVLDDRKKEKERATAQGIPAGSASGGGKAANVKIGWVTWAATNVDSYQTFAERPDMYTPLYTFGSNPCTAGWRLPTKEEFKTLNSLGSSWADAGARGNNVAGRFYGINHLSCSMNNLIGCTFLSAGGYRLSSNRSLNSQGSQGDYLTSTQGSTNGCSLYFTRTYSHLVYHFKANCHSVRCVR